MLAAASTDLFISRLGVCRERLYNKRQSRRFIWFGAPEYSPSFEKVLFRDTKTRDVDLAKEFTHGSTQIFTALEERHWREEGYNLCFIRVNLWPTSPSKSS